MDPRDFAPEDEVGPRRPILPWLRQALTAAVMVAVLSDLAAQRHPPRVAADRVSPATLLAPEPPWQPILRAAPLYALDLADLRLTAALVSARRHVTGGREDTLAAGAFGDPLFLRLTLGRPVADEPVSGFYVELARRAAEAGLSVARTTQASTLFTKFGSVEAAEAVLEGGPSTGPEATCLAFRFTHPDFAFRFHGWLCGSPARPVTARQLACTLDRLGLAAGVDDPVLRALFAQAERRRGEACGRGAQVASARK